jgi:hypothetical protein
MKPRGQRKSGREAVMPLRESDKNKLSHICRQIMAPRHPPRYRMDVIQMPVDQRAESRLRPRPGKGTQQIRIEWIHHSVYSNRRAQSEQRFLRAPAFRLSG